MAERYDQGEAMVTSAEEALAGMASEPGRYCWLLRVLSADAPAAAGEAGAALYAGLWRSDGLSRWLVFEEPVDLAEAATGPVRFPRAVTPRVADDPPETISLQLRLTHGDAFTVAWELYREAGEW